MTTQNTVKVGASLPAVIRVSHSTATEAQRQRVIEALRRRPHHTYDMRSKGISHPAGRVRELNKRGYLIVSDRITTTDSDGFTHVNVALYTLIGEPEAS